MNKSKDAVPNRRDLLKMASVAAPAAIAATVAGSPVDAHQDQAHEGEGLRHTAHTDAYFKSARF